MPTRWNRATSADCDDDEFVNNIADDDDAFVNDISDDHDASDNSFDDDALFINSF